MLHYILQRTAVDRGFGCIARIALNHNRGILCNAAAVHGKACASTTIGIYVDAAPAVAAGCQPSGLYRGTVHQNTISGIAGGCYIIQGRRSAVCLNAMLRTAVAIHSQVLNGCICAIRHQKQCSILAAIRGVQCIACAIYRDAFIHCDCATVRRCSGHIYVNAASQRDRIAIACIGDCVQQILLAADRSICRKYRRRQHGHEHAYYQQHTQNSLLHSFPP